MEIHSRFPRRDNGRRDGVLPAGRTASTLSATFFRLPFIKSPAVVCATSLPAHKHTPLAARAPRRAPDHNCRPRAVSRGQPQGARSRQTRQAGPIVKYRSGTSPTDCRFFLRAGTPSSARGGGDHVAPGNAVRNRGGSTCALLRRRSTPRNNQHQGVRAENNAAFDLRPKPAARPAIGLNHVGPRHRSP